MAKPLTTAGASGPFLTYPEIDDPQKEWCWLAETLTQVGVPFMPDAVQIRWNGAIRSGGNELVFYYGKDAKPVLQRQKTFLEGWIPVIQYDWNDGAVHYQVEIFNFNLEGRDTQNTLTFARVAVKNTGNSPETAYFTAAIQPLNVRGNPNYEFKDNALFQNGTLIYAFSPGAVMEIVPGTPYKQPCTAKDYNLGVGVDMGLARYAVALQPGQSKTLDFKMPRVPTADKNYIQDALKADVADHYKKTVDFWQALLGRKWVIDVPEKRVRDAFKGALIYPILGLRIQRGERIQTDGIPYPNYFISTGYDYQLVYDSLGLTDLVRINVPQLQRRQRPDGMFLDTSLTHGKEIMSSHGQATLLLTRHALFTQDKQWAAEVYPMIQKAVGCIAQDHQTNPNGLIRPSIPYDNELITGCYTSHNLWCLAAVRSAIGVAHLLGKSEDEKNWMALHESFKAAVLKAIDASAKADGYVPTGLYEFEDRSYRPKNKNGQDWENSLLVYPTEVLAPEDPRVAATVDRIRWTKYAEGIMTWNDGKELHHYATCNTAMQDMVAGRSRLALLDIYHILLHAGSTYEGFECQVQPWGDRKSPRCPPPHCWGASKIAALISNMFVMAYGGEFGLHADQRDLYLFSVVSPAWAKSGETIAVRNALTEFGTVSAYMKFINGGAQLKFEKQFHTNPRQLVVRVPYFVRNVSFKTDAKTSSMKGTAIYLSPDATTLDCSWEPDPAPDHNAYQDILLAYRREVGQWDGSWNRMPVPPKGFLTDEEKAHPAEPLSFNLVLEAYKREYARRYYDRIKGGASPMSLSVSEMITDPKERERRFAASFVEVSLVTAKGNRFSAFPEKNCGLVGDGKRYDPDQYWEGDALHGPVWWQVDFGKSTDVHSIVVVPAYKDPKAICRFKVETSLDGTNWTLFADQSQNTEPPTREGYAFIGQQIPMRFLRVSGVKNDANSVLRLVEVMAY
ncbi:MAG: discoidin domain-containing protein [Verrucomicrobiota bacterium]